MISTIHSSALIQYVRTQLNNFFPEKRTVRDKDIKKSVLIALDRLSLCFSHIKTPYYNKNGQPFFDHLHGDHYSMFLYLLSNTLFKEQPKETSLASKVFLLNKSMFGIDAFYGIDLPDFFLFVHPIGTILGRATYSNYFLVYQGVTIGATTEGIYPTFEEKTILYSNSSVIGETHLGSNCIVAAGASLINRKIAPNQVVVGSFPNHRILPNKKDLIHHYFHIQ